MGAKTLPLFRRWCLPLIRTRLPTVPSFLPSFLPPRVPLSLETTGQSRSDNDRVSIGNLPGHTVPIPPSPSSSFWIGCYRKWGSLPSSHGPLWARYRQTQKPASVTRCQTVLRLGNLDTQIWCISYVASFAMLCTFLHMKRGHQYPWMKIKCILQEVENENAFKKRWDKLAVNGSYSRVPSDEWVESAAAELERMLRQLIYWEKKSTGWSQSLRKGFIMILKDNLSVTKELREISTI